MICTPKVRHFWRCIFFIAKKGQIFKKYSAEFKLSVILDMREHHMGYRETARKYELSESGSRVEMLKRLTRIALALGGRYDPGLPPRLQFFLYTPQVIGSRTSQSEGGSPRSGTGRSSPPASADRCATSPGIFHLATSQIFVGESLPLA